MEELRAELAMLEEKYKAVLNEIEKYQDLTTSLHVDSEHLETEMFGVRRKIEALLPVLSDHEKKSLKRDLDYIGKINSVLDIEQCTLRIILEGCHGVKWCASIEPGRDHDPITIYDITIKLWTNSEIIERIVRSCFTQSGCCIKDDTNQEKMKRSQWFSGRNNPSECFERFQYDPEMLDKLLKEV
jgi:hypothetical protein